MIGDDPRFAVPFPPELDIVVWAVKAHTAGEASRLAQRLFDEAASEHLHMAVANLPGSLFSDALKEMQWDQDHVACLRTCLMKPEHLDWIDRIRNALNKAEDRVLG